MKRRARKYKTPKKKTVLNYRKRIKSLENQLMYAKHDIKKLEQQVKEKGVSQYRHELDQAQVMALREQIIKLHARPVGESEILR